MTTTMDGSSGVNAAVAKTTNIATASTPCFASFGRCRKYFMLSLKNNSAQSVLRKSLHFLFLLLLLKSGVVSAQTHEGEYDGVNYSARDSMVMMVKDEIVTFYGDVKLTSEDIKLTAHRVIYNTKKSEICAYGTKDSLGNWIGRPVFTQDGSSFTQDEVCYKAIVTHLMSFTLQTGNSQLVMQIIPIIIFISRRQL